MEISIVGPALDSSQHYDLNPETSQSKSTTKQPSMLALRKLSPCEVKGLKVYTDMEIALARGMEKERRLFWNKTERQLCCETNKSTDTIVKLINTKWREHQSSLLLEEAAKLKIAATYQKS